MKRKSQISSRPAILLAIGSMIFLSALSGCTLTDPQGQAMPPAGIYFAQDEYGRAVEFEGNQYSLRHHPTSYRDGTAEFKDGAWQVQGCCDTLCFHVKDKNLIDQYGILWTPQVPQSPLADTPHSPVNMIVKDHETGIPLADYKFTYYAKAPRGIEVPKWVRAQHIQNKKGLATLDLPISCELFFEVSADGYLLESYGAYQISHDVTANKRALTLEISHGKTVRCIVQDEAGKPVANAEVAPGIFCSPLFVGNWRKAVKTNNDGIAIVNTVDQSIGIYARHPLFEEFGQLGLENATAVKGKSYDYEMKINLKRSPEIKGLVHDEEGQPLADVEVEDGDGKRTLTDKQGKFHLNSSSEYMSFKKDPFTEHQIYDRKPTDTSLDITLQRSYQITGEVVDNTGKPLNTFEVWAGPGETPQDFEIVKKEVAGESRFALEMKEKGRCWVAIRSPGWAVWEGWAELGRNNSPLIARLDRGVTVDGSAKIPDSVQMPLTITLTPQRQVAESFVSSPYAFQTFCSLETKTQNASYSFKNVPPGSYTLKVDGPEITPACLTVRIPPEGRNLPQLEIVGTGMVEGQVFQRDSTEQAPAPLAFADGSIRHGQREIAFKADENGRFRVENVPVGPVEVAIPYHISSDMLSAFIGRGIVAEGKSVKINVNDTTPAILPEWYCRFHVGDGTDPAYANGIGGGVEAYGKPPNNRNKLPGLPLPPSALSSDEEEPPPNEQKPLIRLELYSVDTRDRAEFLLGSVERRWNFNNIPEGSYDASISLGYDGALSRFPVGIIDVKNGDEPDLELASNSICGRFLLPEVAKSQETTRSDDLHIIAVHDKKIICEASASPDGIFVLPFLPTGDYIVAAHHPKLGWWRKAVDVKDGVTRLGDLSLQHGATVKGKLLADWEAVPTSGNCTIRAISDDGIIVKNFIGWMRDNDNPIVNERPFELNNLAPGNWTLILMANDKAIRSRHIKIEGNETVSADLLGGLLTDK